MGLEHVLKQSDNLLVKVGIIFLPASSSNVTLCRIEWIFGSLATSLKASGLRQEIYVQDLPI